MPGNGDPIWVRGAIAAVTLLAPFSVGSLVYLRAADIQRFDERCAEVRRELDKLHGTIGGQSAKLDAITGTLAGVAVEARRNAAETAEVKTEVHEIQRRFRTGGGM